ncbi:hypothetical protein BDN70DRAFT_936845 [Pholiota conissans]|uniref:Uncharacterized protein n=1 Tax=Pholiota conissans TaxID=109636 RepID=A0A9P6CW37_9AGAR|nr:hypothetical protein BDN70DRAFT_936845 [Pholiota conissans]
MADQLDAGETYEQRILRELDDPVVKSTSSLTTYKSIAIRHEGVLLGVIDTIEGSTTFEIIVISERWGSSAPGPHVFPFLFRTLPQSTLKSVAYPLKYLLEDGMIDEFCGALAKAGTIEVLWLTGSEKPETVSEGYLWVSTVRLLYLLRSQPLLRELYVPKYVNTKDLWKVLDMHRDDREDGTQKWFRNLMFVGNHVHPGIFKKD